MKIAVRSIAAVISSLAMLCAQSHGPSGGVAISHSAFDSLSTLISRLVLSGGLTKKGEFETSERFEARRAALLKSNSRRYSFLKEADDSEFSYDADSATLHMALTPVGRTIQGNSATATFTITTTIIGRSSYVGTNAFGVKKTIISTRFSQYEVAMSDDSGYDFPEKKIGDYGTGEFESLERTVAMTASRAKALKPYLRFAFYGKLADSQVFLDSESTTATISSPYEHNTQREIVLFNIEAIKVVDSRTGAVVVDATTALNTVDE
jgi:hypothetical protein